MAVRRQQSYFKEDANLQAMDFQFLLSARYQFSRWSSCIDNGTAEVLTKKEDVRSKSICVSRLNFSCGRPGRRWPRCGCRCASWRPRRRGARLRWRQRGGSTGRGWRGWRPPSRRTSRPAWSYGSSIQIFFTFFIKYFLRSMHGTAAGPLYKRNTGCLLVLKGLSGVIKFESLA